MKKINKKIIFLIFPLFVAVMSLIAVFSMCFWGKGYNQDENSIDQPEIYVESSKSSSNEKVTVEITNTNFVGSNTFFEIKDEDEKEVVISNCTFISSGEDEAVVVDGGDVKIRNTTFISTVSKQGTAVRVTSGSAEIVYTNINNFNKGIEVLSGEVDYYIPLGAGNQNIYDCFYACYASGGELNIGEMDGSSDIVIRGDYGIYASGNAIVNFNNGYIGSEDYLTNVGCGRAAVYCIDEAVVDVNGTINQGGTSTGIYVSGGGICNFGGEINSADTGIYAFDGGVCNVFGNINYTRQAISLEDNGKCYVNDRGYIEYIDCAFSLNENSELYMSGGTVAASRLPAVKVDKNSTFELSGGTINVATGETVDHEVITGSFKMKGGMIDGAETVNGGVALVNDGETVVLDGGIIQNCMATNGGAIYVALGGTLELGGVTIDNCSATNGGAIYNVGTVKSSSDGGKTTIKNCSASEGNGGGIHNASTGEINLTTSGIEIDSCSVWNGSGGGIYNDNELKLPASTTIKNCEAQVSSGVTVSDYTQVAGTGGAIFSTNRTKLTLSGTENETIKIYDCDAVCGGAISNKTAMSLSYVEIANCSASRTGGAIYTDYTTQAQSLSNVTITGSSLPSGKSSGVAIRVRGASANYTPYTITNCNFDKNDVITASANAMFMQYVNMEINASSFKNISDGSENDKTIGIAIRADASDVKLCGGTTISGYGSMSSTGGAIVANSGSRLYVHDATISNNVAQSGGGIYISGRASSSNIKDNGELRRSSLTLYSGSNITGNQATNGAGIYVGDVAKAYVQSGAKITTNTASTSGGGIYATGAILEIAGNVSSNTTGKTGGGVYLLNCESVSLNGSEINDNRAQNGGGVYVSGVSISEINIATTISGNIATTNGGAMFIESGSSLTINHKDATIKGNNALRGAGLYLGKSELNLHDGIISGNGAVEGDIKTSYGSGVYASNSIINMSGGEISDGKTINSGTGIHTVGEVTINFSGGNILNNVSTTGAGGGILVAGTSTLNMTGGKISGNSASQAGGISFSGTGAKGYLSGGEISGNIANAYIAGLGITGSYVELSGDINIIDNCVKTDISLTNSSSGHAAGISIDQSGTGEPGTLVMNGGTIANNYVYDDNSKEGHGGGVFINRGSDFVMNGGIIRNNNVSAGGNSSGAQIFVTQDVDEINTTSFTMNGGTIIGDGSQALYGGILVSMGELNLLGGTIESSNSVGSDIIVGNNVTLGGEVNIDATIALLKNDIFAYLAGANLDGEEIGYMETMYSIINLNDYQRYTNTITLNFFDGQYDMYNKRFHISEIGSLNDTALGYDAGTQTSADYYENNPFMSADSKKLLYSRVIEFYGQDILGRKTDSTNADWYNYYAVNVEFEDPNPNEKTILDVISYKTFDGEIVLPNSVTTINAHCFDSVPITNIIFSNCLSSIGEYAFYGCTGLEKLTIPSSITSLGGYAFAKCTSLTKLTIDATTLRIDNTMFADCMNIDTLKICSNVEVNAFSNRKNLINLTIGEEVTRIGKYAFTGCISLESVTIPNSVSTLSSECFYSCSSLETVTIGTGVQILGADAFGNCAGLKTLDVKTNHLTITPSMFGGCSQLRELKTNSNVQDGAFAENTTLEKIIFDVDVTSVGSSLFTASTKVSELRVLSTHLDDQINKDMFGGFYYYDEENSKEYTMKVLEIHSNVGPNDFSELGDWSKEIKKVIIGDEVELASDDSGGPFWATIIEELIIGKNVVARNQSGILNEFDFVYSVTINSAPIGTPCFAEFYLTTLEIGDDVETIEEGVFKDCTKLTSLTIGSSVKTIGEGAFANCTGLTSLTIGSNVRSIGEGCFSKPSLNSQSSLISLTVETPYLTIDKTMFGGCESLESLFTNSNIEEEGFKELKNLKAIEIGESVNSVSARGFFDGSSPVTYINNIESIIVSELNDTYTDGGTHAIINKQTKELVLGCKNTILSSTDDINSIADLAFYNCTELDSITIPSGVTSIGEYAFYYCKKLTSITIPDGVESINEWSFYKCSELTSITIPSNVTSIGEYAFSGCTGIKKLSICTPSLTISQDMFGGGSMLKDLYTESHIADNGFYKCSNLDIVKIGSGNEYGEPRRIGNSAFPSIYYLSILTNVEEASFSSAFGECEGIKELIIKNNDDKTISKQMFGGCESLMELTTSCNIAERGFENLNKLQSVTITGGSIGNYAFVRDLKNGKQKLTIDLGEGVDYIGKMAFYVADDDHAPHSALNGYYPEFGGVFKVDLSKTTMYTTLTGYTPNNMAEDALLYFTSSGIIYWVDYDNDNTIDEGEVLTSISLYYIIQQSFSTNSD